MAKRKIAEEVSTGSLEQVASSMREYLKDEVATSGVPAWYLSTGNYAFNYIVSGKLDGGWPSGIIVELYGDPSSGKTVFITKAGAEIQKQDGIFVLADAEGRWDEEFARVHGIDPALVVRFYPETVEDFAVKVHHILDKWGKEKKVVVGLDSLAILTTIKEVSDVEEGDIKADQGRKAQKIKAAMRVLRTQIRETGAILLVSNHLIANPNSYIPGNKQTPGGGGVPFQASIRVEFLNPIKILLPGKDRPVGVTIRARVTKNSVAPPFGECSMNLHWSYGVSQFSGLLEVMEDLGIVSQAGGWYMYNEHNFRGRDIETFIQEHPEIMQDVKWSKPYFLEV